MSDQKIALITGASRGIGHAILVQLAKQGFTVVGTATGAHGAARIDETLQENGALGAGLILNVADPVSISACLNSIKERFGALSVLVNNAGVTHDNLIMRLKDEDWDAVMQTNLTSVFRLCREVVRDMMKARWGRIINIGSVVGTSGNAGQTNYAASKAGLIGFSKSLALEIASRGITVNVVSPGFIATDMTAKLNEAQQAALLQRIPLGRMGEAADIAHAVCFLASEQAAYMTGQTLHVNGGMLME